MAQVSKVDTVYKNTYIVQLVKLIFPYKHTPIAQLLKPVLVTTIIHSSIGKSDYCLQTLFYGAFGKTDFAYEYISIVQFKKSGYYCSIGKDSIDSEVLFGPVVKAKYCLQTYFHCKLNYHEQNILQIRDPDIRKHWTAFWTLLGLISSLYPDIPYWSSNQRPQNAEPKL